ncbi:uncharacterized protein LOC100279258 [Zea mays]|uniref:Polymerase/histidinol phosphatase-like n=1 Tax=Zea mays TaxID=4577 RepID=B7ZX76_MAIZE|nr:uncharacterized protein LOC100279258 [Zea mays]ACL52525.1 unknown [Zea mays]|eukprot:NP_001145751.1 uncharacterized protein LOC100279258 [Zea mays]
MAAPLLFYDLGLIASSSSGDGRDGNSSSSRLQLLATTARALELGYAGVALDHHHRGLLADSHVCRTDTFAPLSSLPLPSSAALHRRRLASPASEAFRQYTRITLSLDSAAATASALAPSAARLLRTYDLVAARPLTQAAFDHLCQTPLSAQHLDLISIDFSSHGKMPFRIKPPMLKLALQKGLHFEIAYSPLLSTDVNDKRNLIAQVKLLVDWTKGKNLIISSAAHTASQIRGPYDVINLSAYLLGIPIDRAKAAMSTSCRSLVLKAMRKKHFYKETIRVDRLLPNEELSSTKFKLADWIGWNSVSSEGVANQLEPSSNFDEVPGSPVCGIMEGSHEKTHSPDLSVVSKLPEQPSHQEQFPSQTQEDTLQVDRTVVVTDSGQSSIFPASFNYQNAILEKAENNEVFVNPFVQPGAGCSADPEIIVKHVEFVQDTMEVDTIESCRTKLMGDNIASTSDTSTKLACSSLLHGRELSGTSLEDQGPGHSSESLANEKYDMKYHTDCTYGVNDKTLLVQEILSGADIWPEDKDSDGSAGMQVDNEASRGTSESLECPPCGVDDKAPSDLSFYSSHKLCTDVAILPKVVEGKVEQSRDENIVQTVENEAESVDTKTRTSISVEPMSHGQEISSTIHTRNTGASCESDELKEQNSKNTDASLDKSVAKMHELLKFPYPSGKVEMSTIRPEKRRHKLRLHHPAYLPFLGFLWSACFKKKICKVARKRKS